jgi:hypothetical protein
MIFLAAIVAGLLVGYLTYLSTASLAGSVLAGLGATGATVGALDRMLTQ